MPKATVVQINRSIGVTEYMFSEPLNGGADRVLAKVEWGELDVSSLSDLALRIVTALLGEDTGVSKIEIKTHSIIVHFSVAYKSRAIREAVLDHTGQGVKYRVRITDTAKLLRDIILVLCLIGMSLLLIAVILLVLFFPDLQ